MEECWAARRSEPRLSVWGAQEAPKSPPETDERLAQLTECCLCFDPFADEPTRSTPRNMACGHTFCQGCLELMLVKLPREDRATHKTLPCPTCRVETRVPGGKAEMLVKNFLALG